MNIKKYSWLAALPLLFTACHEDMLMENTSNQGVTTLTATVEDGSASSRAQIVLNGTSTTKESFHWNANDEFTLYQVPYNDEVGNYVDLSYHPFIIDENYNEEQLVASADFSTTKPLTVGREYVAFYPSQEIDEENPQFINLAINNTLNNNSETSWVNYFKNNMFMMKRGVVSENNNVQFEHLCGIIRITYKNTSNQDRTIKGLYVNGSWGNSLNYSLYDLEEFPYGGGGSLGRYGLEFTEGAVVPAGRTENFYILFVKDLIPEADKERLSRIEIKLWDDNYMGTPEYSEELPFFQVGKSYWLNVTDDGENLFWTNDQQGGTDNPDEGDSVLRHVSTFAELQSALAEDVAQMNIELAENIDLKLEAPLTVNTETNLRLNGSTISLSDDYVSMGMPAVFNVNDVELHINEGSLNGHDGSKLHDFYFRVMGREAGVWLHDVSLSTGTVVPSAFYMYHSHIYLEGTTSVRTHNFAVYFDSPVEIEGYTWSRIRTTGTIEGDFFLNNLNCRFEMWRGTINGNFGFSSLLNSDQIPDHFGVADEVVIADGCTGWEAVGRIVKDQNYEVTTFAQLKTALANPQEGDESTNIHLMNDITLTEQLIIDKPVYLHTQGYKLTLGYTLQTGEGAIINNRDLFVRNAGVIEAPSTGTEVDAYLFKSGGGMLDLRHVRINAGIVKNVAYIKDGKGRVYENAVLNASGYTLDIESDRYSDVDIYTGTLNGDVRWKLNSANYTDLCRFGAGPESTINGDLVWAGEYGGTATGYRIEFGSPVYINGDNWVTTDGSGDSGNTGLSKISVSTFDELKRALEAPQQAEITYISLNSDITLTEQLVVNKPVELIMNSRVLRLGYTLQAGEGAIINNSDLYISKVGIIEAPSTGTEVDAYLIKSGSGMVFLRNLTINAGIVKNAVYIKDGKGRVYESATINASGYTLDIESDRYSDVDIYTGTLNGDVRWKLNSANYTDHCRFGAGPESTINGDLVWAGEYGGTATGYKIEFGSPVYIDGTNWVTTNGSGGGDSGDESGDEASAGSFSELMKAINTPSITRIYFTNNIALEEPLVIDHRVQIDLNKYTLSLNSEKFQGGASGNVIDVVNDGVSFYFDNGVVDFTEFGGKMNSCIRTTGYGVKLYMADIDILLGNNFGPAIWLDDDQFTFSKGYKMPTISAPVAIQYQTRTHDKNYHATVNANINGKVIFDNVNSTVGGLNTTFEFMSGKINGSLDIGAGVGDNVNIAEHVKFQKGVVTFGENATGWDKAGMIVN